MKHLRLMRFLISIFAMQGICAAAHAHSNVKTGWKPYIGAGIGYGVLDVENKYNETTALPSWTSSKGASVARGPVEYLFLGIQKQIHSMVLGSEVYGFLGQQKSKMHQGDYSGAFRAEAMQRKYGYGLKLKTGYCVNPMALAYVHVGLENTKFQYAVSGKLTNPYTFKKNKNLMGVPLGAGFEFDVSPQWKTRLEYTYTQYNTWKTGDVAAGSDVVTMKLSPSQHAVVLGFSYKI